IDSFSVFIIMVGASPIQQRIGKAEKLTQSVPTINCGDRSIFRYVLPISRIFNFIGFTIDFGVNLYKPIREIRASNPVITKTYRQLLICITATPKTGPSNGANKLILPISEKILTACLSLNFS